MKPAILAFNRGLISELGLARIDLKRMAFSASYWRNFMARSLGSMMLRPGLKYLGTTRANQRAFFIPFVFASDDTALLELTDGAMRVWINDTLVKRPAVTTAVVNGTFVTDLSGWTIADEAGASSTWATGGFASLVGTDFERAIIRQQVTVVGADTNVEHALAIEIARGNVGFKVGSAEGEDDLISETTLAPGNHSLAFTPTGTFWIELQNSTQWAALIESVQIESAGNMEVPAPWEESDLYPSRVRYDESADVIFVACRGKQQRRIERRGAHSWSVVLYQADKGPLRTQNLTTTTITPSATAGDITLTASENLFKDGYVGAIFKLPSAGQTVSATVTAENQFSDPIRVTGVGAARAFSVVRAGVWVATVTLQYSVGAVGSWVDYTTYTTTGSVSVTDGFDNQIIYWRIGVKTGDFTSGSVALTLSFTQGSIDGFVRITGINSQTEATAAVTTALGGTAAVSDWSEGEWSDYRGWPSAVALAEGRLFWAGHRGKIQGSVSDSFDDFDDTTEGDSGPLNRSLGSGPVDSVNWLLALQRLIAGSDGAEISIRSSSFDEPLSPTQFNPKRASTEGSARVAAIEVDSRGVFVQKSGTRVMQLDFASDTYDYKSEDLTLFAPEVGEPSITRLVVQRKPDTRIHAVRSDGVVAVCVHDKAENVLCWQEIDTDGAIEDAVVLPGQVEDQVYYVVNRTINGITVRYLEKWALESECQGGALNKQADAFVISGSGGKVVSGLGHLEDKDVVVWADGTDRGVHHVRSGAITLEDNASVGGALVGLRYVAKWRSTKLAYNLADGVNLSDRKRVTHLGLVLKNTHAQGLQFGPDFDHLDDMPMREQGAAVDQDSINDYNEDSIMFPGTYTVDSRVCLQAAAPRPCTVLAAVIGLETAGK